VADDGGALAGAHLGGDRRVVAGAHHVREREQRRHQRVVLADGGTKSVPSACGTRTASACAPATSPLPKKPPCTHDVCRPSWQNSQVPSENANGITTRSPSLIVRTSAPTVSTTPIASWPITRPVSLSSSVLYGHRSLPQMQAWVTRTTASVGSITAGSGTFAMRTSPAPYMTVARIELPPVLAGCGRCRVLLVADVVAPRDDAALIVGLLHGGVGHEPLRRGAVPVILARLEEDAIARADHLDLAATALAEADALGDPDRLAVRVRVPGGSRSRREVDAARGDPRRLRRRRDRVDEDRAGEPVARSRTRVEAVPGD